MIRTCPQCRAFYADASTAFCLADGAPLVELNPLGDEWGEATRAVEEKSKALAKQARRLKWRRVMMITTTTLVITLVVCVVTINSLIYLRPGPEARPALPPKELVGSTNNPTPDDPSPTPDTTVPTTDSPPADTDKDKGKDKNKNRNTNANRNDNRNDNRNNNRNDNRNDNRNGNRGNRNDNRDDNRNESRNDNRDHNRNDNRNDNRNGDTGRGGNGNGQVNINRHTNDNRHDNRNDNRHTNTGVGTGSAGGGNPHLSPVPGPPSGGRVNPKTTPTPRTDADTNPAPRSDAVANPAACTDADKVRERESVIGRARAVWQRDVEREQAGIAARHGDAAPRVQFRLGREGYEVLLRKPCTSALVTARYEWEVSSPVKSVARVRKKKTFFCCKARGFWVCTQLPANNGYVRPSMNTLS